MHPSALNAPAALLARAAAAARACAPVVDLLIRVCLAQLFWMRGLAGLTDWHGALATAPGVAAALAMHPHRVATLVVAARRRRTRPGARRFSASGSLAAGPPAWNSPAP